MKYERLTERYNAPKNVRADGKQIYARLWALENGIEDGTALLLPCKIGDPVYHLLGKCSGNKCPYNGDFGQWRCSYKGQRMCYAFVDEIPFELSHIADLGVHIFLTREEAEEALKARGY